MLIGCIYLALGKGGNYPSSPHADSEYGVLRDSGFPRGDCSQCHTQHDGESPWDFCLFTANTNSLCYAGNSCHLSAPPGYPAGESDRMPEGSDYPGYFEYNSGGIKIPGVENRKRWPGQLVFENPNAWAAGKYYSSHRNDPDMPLKDANGYGLCRNCHDPHGTSNHFDMLDTTYLNVQGSQIGGRPSNYQLCFDCHSTEGPSQMDQENRYIADYYDQSINDDAESGHQLRRNEGYLRQGDKLPCYDCHNPHGSQGNDGVHPNAFLISDQRPGWSGLDSIKTSNHQVRKFCFGCHQSSDLQGGGEVEGLTLSGLTAGIPAHVYGDSTHCYDCHGRDYSDPTSRNVHHPSPGGDCIVCHAYAQDAGDGPPARRDITGAGGDFERLSHHVTDGSANEVVTVNDCGVCHMEGDPSSGEINDYHHMNNQLDLRGPDTGAPLTPFTLFSRDTSTSVLESWVIDVQNNLCLKCHDADGASSSGALTPGGTPLRPFTSNSRDVPDVFDAFGPTAGFHHAVRGPGSNSYCTPTSTNGNLVTMEPPWNQTPGAHDVISCFDCHLANGHGGDFSGMLREETYYKEATPNPDFGAAAKSFCTRCHKSSVYLGTGDGSRFGEHNRRSHSAAGVGGRNQYGCRGCHAGIYEDDGDPGCENGSGWLTIHGGSFVWPPCSQTPSSQSLKFLLGGYLSGWEQSTPTQATCYGGGCHHSEGQSY